VPTNYLTSGDTRSCGCLHAERAAALGRAKKADLTGRTFGRLTVLLELCQPGRRDVRWLCACRCGLLTAATSTRLISGRVLSCGCLRDELARARAPLVGARRSVRGCRTCGRVYTATGPQKECSAQCRARWHAADEARRRQERAIESVHVEAARLRAELQRRVGGGEDTDDRAG
jgi:hypothetical protein